MAWNSQLTDQIFLNNLNTFSQFVIHTQNGHKKSQPVDLLIQILITHHLGLISQTNSPITTPIYCVTPLI